MEEGEGIMDGVGWEWSEWVMTGLVMGWDGMGWVGLGGWWWWGEWWMLFWSFWCDDGANLVAVAA